VSLVFKSVRKFWYFSKLSFKKLSLSFGLSGIFFDGAFIDEI
jgi:hypothetical protein